MVIALYPSTTADGPRLGPLGRVLDKLVLGRKMRSGTRETVANLRRLLEAEAPARLPNP